MTGKRQLSRRGKQLTNRAIAELFALEAEKAEGHLRKALLRASHAALLWPIEASEVIKRNGALTELSGIGPFLAKSIQRWLENPPCIDPVPETRRDFLSLTEARAVLSGDPQWQKLLKGDLQMHSNWSDGSASIEEMARAALAFGYEYIAITDHSKGLKIAGGMDESELETQREEIQKAEASITRTGKKFRIFKSIEMNLNPQGEGDMDSNSLESLDLVLGSFHSSLRGREDQTSRYLAALRNHDVHILGHPRGRVYNQRSGLTADWSRVFAEAAKLDKAVEIDGYSDRQDLDIKLLKIAKKEGTRISLGSDAHAPWQLAFMEFSLAAALKAGIRPDRIINFLPAAKLLAWVRGIQMNCELA